MARIIMLVPAALGAGSRVVSFGLMAALNLKGVHTTLVPELDVAVVEKALAQNHLDEILESLLEQCDPVVKNNDIVIVRGMASTKPYASELNLAIAMALDAAVIFVVPGQQPQEALGQLKITANPYQHRNKQKTLGFVINRVDLQEETTIKRHIQQLGITIPFLGNIPYRRELTEERGRFHSEKAGESLGKYFNLNWLWPFLNNVVEAPLTPTMFRYRLTQSAQLANKKIILPEGTDSRVVQAANICAARGIARCVLLGNKHKIATACAEINLRLNEQIEIIEPDAVVEKYVRPLYEARRNKGLTIDAARAALTSNTMLGTMMLHLGEVDGLVSGAAHTTADTLRPALQIIKTAPNVKLVSSVFFMCLPEQVLIYGDCAINPNPSAEQLADIAIQSAQTATKFGITPRVAMLSYSTMSSAAGPDVDKVKQATQIAKEREPHLDIDGPLQYDAAVSEKVAALKAPNSRVAGKATVFIAPDLGVGNIFYKAVQRSTGILCIGPILQGLNKPVNDLSRGCTVQDIVFTIAITAVQGARF